MSEGKTPARTPTIFTQSVHHSIEVHQSSPDVTRKGKAGEKKKKKKEKKEARKEPIHWSYNIKTWTLKQL